MLYHEDWFMRQVQMMVSFLIRFLAGDKEEDPDALHSTIGDSQLYRELESLVLSDQICKAEDLLYERADGEDMGAFYAGLHFYEQISMLSEAHLESCNFSRAEITEGIFELCHRYRISTDILSMHLGEN